MPILDCHMDPNELDARLQGCTLEAWRASRRRGVLWAIPEFLEKRTVGTIGLRGRYTRRVDEARFAIAIAGKSKR
jgi:hypothetical protein